MRKPGLSLVVTLVVTALYAAAIAVAFAPARAATPSFWITLVLANGVFAAGAALLLRRTTELAPLFRPAWGDFSRAFLIAVVLYAATSFFRRLVLPPGSPAEGWLVHVYLHLGDPRAVRAHVGLFAAGLAVIVLGEELVFRALVPSLLEGWLGSRKAFPAAAVLYALAHVPTMFLLKDGRAGLNPLIVLAALFAGLVWGALVRATGRVLPAFFSHLLFDWAIVLAFPLWGWSL